MVEETRMHYDAAMLDIGREKQIFVDDLIIESIENVCRTWHQPVRATEDPIIVSDQAWEKITYFTFNSSQVIRDLRDGLFKCISEHGPIVSAWRIGVAAPVGDLFQALPRACTPAASH